MKKNGASSTTYSSRNQPSWAIGCRLAWSTEKGMAFNSSGIAQTLAANARASRCRPISWTAAAAGGATTSRSPPSASPNTAQLMTMKDRLCQSSTSKMRVSRISVARDVRARRNTATYVRRIVRSPMTARRRRANGVPSKITTVALAGPCGTTDWPNGYVLGHSSQRKSRQSLASRSQAHWPMRSFLTPRCCFTLTAVVLALGLASSARCADARAAGTALRSHVRGLPRRHPDLHPAGDRRRSTWASG